MPTRGFTLKELTVILVLLAVAVAAAAPAVEAARQRDRRIVCANNLRIIWEGPTDKRAQYVADPSADPVHNTSPGTTPDNQLNRVAPQTGRSRK